MVHGGLGVLRAMQRRATQGFRSRGVILLLAGAVAAAAWSPATAQLPSGSWALAFADEFSGSSLDRTKWSPNYSWGRTHNHMAYMDPGQLAVSDGRLRITAVKERHPDAPTHAVHDGKWYRLDYTSGAVQTADTFRFTDGYVEARMRLPGEIGAWAAFWTLGQGWPPEIDIMEYPIMDHDQSNNDKYRYWVNYHYGADWTQHRSYGKEHWQGRDLSSGYNTYGVEWTANDQLHFSLNGTRVYSITDSAAVSQLRDQYLILNYAVGGWPGTPPSWPAGGSNFDIDWVRVWQRPSGTTSTRWTGTSASGSWTTGGNWSDGPPRLAGQTARFGTVAGRSAVAVDWSASQTLAELHFDGSTRYTLGNADESLMLADGPGGDGWVGIRVSPEGPSHTINTRLDLYGRFSVWNDGGILTLARDLDEQAGGFAAVGEMSVGGSGTTILSGQSRLSGPLAVRSGMLVVTGRLFAGRVAADAGVTVTGGTLYVSSLSDAASGSLGSLASAADRLVIDGGTLRIAGSGTSNRGFTVGARGATLEAQAGVTVTLGETGTPTQPAADGVVATSGGRLTLTGAGTGILAKRITGPGSLVKEGAGTWTLAAANGLLGGTSVEAGRLVATTTAALGTGPVAVAADATLTIGAAGGIPGGVSGTGTIEAAQASGAVVITAPANPFAGTWVVRPGAQLRGYSGNAAAGGEFGTAAATVEVEAGGQVRFFNVTTGSRSFSQRLVLSGDGIAGGNPGALNHDAATASSIRWSGPVEIDGAASVGVQNAARLTLDRVRPAAAAGPAALTLDTGGGGTSIDLGDVAGLTGLMKRGAGTTSVTAALDLPAGTLTIAGGRLSLPHDVRLVATVAALEVDPVRGLLDLGSGRIDIAPAGVTAAGLRAGILAGRGDGSWNGSMGITSGAAAAGRGRTVGYLVRPDGSAAVSFAAAGDVDLNGRVDVFDLVSINTAGRFGTGLPAAWSDGDVNYDGVTSVFDLVAVNGGGAYNAGGYLPPAVSGSGHPASAVPEPRGSGLVAAWLTVLSAWFRGRLQRSAAVGAGTSRRARFAGR